MDIRINEELRAYIDPLTEDEFSALERSLLAEGCRDALVLWGDLLVDGHNRYTICKKHDLQFQTVQNTRFETIDDVHLWMIDNHLGRRSVSDFQRGVLALRKKEIMALRAASGDADGNTGPDSTGIDGAGGTSAQDSRPGTGNADGAGGEHGAAAGASGSGESRSRPAIKSREAIAREARISSTTVSHIEKIQKAAAPELVAAVKLGTISINAAAAVASLPEDEQIAAVAGGRKELREAARRVRASKTPTRRAPRADDAGANASTDSTATTADGVAPWEASPETASSAEVAQLRARVASLTEENTVLKQRIAELMSQLNEANPAV
ncbi:Plasmid replication/partition related protein [Pararobbsia alpina]|uniref:hypothetical protein n=1 Tax=Pararobbsia alpina TaxID=621374 RepID=UPI0039A723CC